jgi:hypothetical protein
LVAVYLACFRDWQPFLNVGERGTVMIVAADRRQARTILRYVKGLIQIVPMLKQTIETERLDGLDLSNKVTVEVHTRSFRSVRGYSCVACLADEMAFWFGEDSANPDFEVLNAIRPAMATVPGSMLLVASSPYARKGALWEAYHKHFGKGGPILVWRAATTRMNPTVSQSFIDAEYEKDPIAAAAEYGAQFRTDIESFVSRESVEACVDWGTHERGFLSRHRYVAFCDPSGGSGGDSFTVAVAHNEGGLGMLDCTRGVKPPFSPEGVVNEFADLLKNYRITKVVGDRFAGEWPREQFRKKGIQYDASAKPKSDLYRDALPLINSGAVRLLGDKRFVNQLISLERNTARGGRDSIDHARGAHDDVANAVAGALLLAGGKKPHSRLGAIGTDGVVHWHNTDEPRQHVHYISVDERGRELTTPEQFHAARYPRLKAS